jgi:hypothetical protein
MFTTIALAAVMTDNCRPAWKVDFSGRSPGAGTQYRLRVEVGGTTHTLTAHTLTQQATAEHARDGMEASLKGAFDFEADDLALIVTELGGKPITKLTFVDISGWAPAVSPTVVWEPAKADAKK